MHNSWSKWTYTLQIIFTLETDRFRQDKKHVYLVPSVWLLLWSLWSLYARKHLDILLQIPHLQLMHPLGPAGFLLLQLTSFNSCVFLSGAMLCGLSIPKLLSLCVFKMPDEIHPSFHYFGWFPPAHPLFFSLSWSAGNWFSRDLRYSLLWIKALPVLLANIINASSKMRTFTYHFLPLQIFKDNLNIMLICSVKYTDYLKKIQYPYFIIVKAL